METMGAMIFVGLLAVHILGFMNGANDISKTVATLLGSGLTGRKKAILYGAAWNTIGGLFAYLIAFSLGSVFSKGIVTAELTLLFAASVIGAAAAWVFVSTFFKVPVSTTHSIVGALTFLGWFVFGTSSVAWKTLFYKIALPLIVSPPVALILTAVAVRVLNPIKEHKWMDKMHWVSSAAASFARGMQDTAKIAALSVIFMMAMGVNLDKPFSMAYWSYICVALVMGLGGLLWGLGVTKRLAFDIIKLHHKDAFAANAITAILVIFGGWLGLPMSTTHVSSLAITGTATKLRSINWKVLGGIIGAWIITLPLSGLFAVIIYSLGAVVF